MLQKVENHVKQHGGINEMQEDIKGEAPSYRLNVNAFYWLNDVLLKHGYISRPVEFQRLTGSNP